MAFFRLQKSFVKGLWFAVIEFQIGAFGLPRVDLDRGGVGNSFAVGCPMPFPCLGDYDVLRGMS